MQKPVSNAYFYASLTESYRIIQTHHDFTNSKNLKKHVEKTSITMGIHPSRHLGRLCPGEFGQFLQDRSIAEPKDFFLIRPTRPRQMGMPMDSRCQKGPRMGNADLQAEIQIFFKWKEMEDFLRSRENHPEPISVDVPAMLGDSRLGMNHPG